MHCVGWDELKQMAIPAVEPSARNWFSGWVGDFCLFCFTEKTPHIHWSQGSSTGSSTPPHTLSMINSLTLSLFHSITCMLSHLFLFYLFFCHVLSHSLAHSVIISFPHAPSPTLSPIHSAFISFLTFTLFTALSFSIQKQRLGRPLTGIGSVRLHLTDKPLSQAHKASKNFFNIYWRN